MTTHPAILRAMRLRTIVEMPEYKDTIGAWIVRAKDDALYSMTTATEPHEVHRAQGAYNALIALIDQVEIVFSAERLAAKQNKTKEK